MRIITICFLLVFGVQAISASGKFSQNAGSEVFHFKIIKNKIGPPLIVRGKNVTNNPGHDNQPSFSYDSQSILFTSSRRGRKDTDIYEYSLATGKTARITSTEESEYSPRALDANTITFVREGKGQEMTVWKYNRSTKKESLAFHVKEPIAYYAWNFKGDALVWVRYASMVRWINTQKGINEYVANYAQPSAPQQVPATPRFSFMERQPNDQLWIKEFNPNTRAIRPIVQSKDGKKDYCWMLDGSLLVGSGTKLYRFDERNDKNWVLLADLKSFGIKDITRLAVSFNGKELALVSNQ